MSQGRASSDSLKSKYTPRIIHNKIQLNIDEVNDYFKNHTLKECAEYFGCSKITIKRKLNAAGIDTSIHNHSELAIRKHAEKLSKIHLSKDELYDLYINSNMDSKSIAELYDVHYNTIRKLIKKYNLVKSRHDVSKSMMSRHFKNHGCSHPSQREDVLSKTRKSTQKVLYYNVDGRNFTFRSLHELSYALLLDYNSFEWYYEDMRIPYVDNITGKWRIYVIDFTVITDSETYWVEVKPNNNMIPLDKRIYANRRAEDAGVIYRGNTDEERTFGKKLLFDGYRSEFIEFLYNKPSSSAKQVSYYFKNEDCAKKYNLDGWKYHHLVKHSDNLVTLKLRKC